VWHPLVLLDGKVPCLGRPGEVVRCSHVLSEARVRWPRKNCSH
jgi:hypothetical protein